MGEYKNESKSESRVDPDNDYKTNHQDVPMLNYSGNRTPASAAWANECAGWVALGRAPEAKGLYVIGREANMVWARPGQGAPRGLPVMLLVERATADAETQLRAAIRAFALPTTPLYVSLPPEGELDGWRIAARRLGFRHESIQLLMTCSLTESRSVAEPARHQVVEAQSDEDWTAALRVIGEVYDDPPGLTRFYNPRDVVRLFLIRVNNEPAAAAALWPFGGVAGVYSVATRKRFRGLGLAYAVVERILRRAQAEGFQLASLRTTGDLFALYMRHGFGIAGQVHRYRLG